MRLVVRSVWEARTWVRLMPGAIMAKQENRTFKELKRLILVTKGLQSSACNFIPTLRGTVKDIFPYLHH
jgi:hypothetical protein